MGASAKADRAFALRAEPEVSAAVAASIPCAWKIAGSWPYFEVEPSEGPSYNFLGAANDVVVNGEYPSKRAALDSLIADLEDTRQELSGQIARHKLARRRLARADA